MFKLRLIFYPELRPGIECCQIAGATGSELVHNDNINACVFEHVFQIENNHSVFVRVQLFHAGLFTARLTNFFVGTFNLLRFFGRILNHFFGQSFGDEFVGMVLRH